MSDFDNEMQKSTQSESQNRRDQDLYGGLIRLHILHHASKGPVFGLWILAIDERSGKSSSRMYRATPLGRKVLVAARERISELFDELLEDE
jgi:hypothetical protein